MQNNLFGCFSSSTSSRASFLFLPHLLHECNLLHLSYKERKVVFSSEQLTEIIMFQCGALVSCLVGESNVMATYVRTPEGSYEGCWQQEDVRLEANWK